MFCRNCGSELVNDVCPKCGNSNGIENNLNSSQTQGYNSVPFQQVEKPKKKKHGCLIGILVFVLIIVLIVIISVVGSSGKKQKDNGTVSVNSTASEENSNSVEINTKSENESVDDGENVERGDVSKEENQVIYDADQVKITYTGYTAAKLFTSASLNFIIENNSDKNITVENFHFEVNGYTLDGWFYEDVPAGKKVNASIDLSSYELEQNGIDKLGTVVFSFRAVNSDTYDEIFVTDDVTVTFDESVSSNEDVSSYQEVYSGNDITVYYKGIDDNSLSGKDFNFLVVNNSDKNVMVVAESVSINGFAINSASLYASCSAGKMTNDTISVWGSELEDQKIDEINEIEFSLKCHDSDTYDDIWDAGTITITIK
ncbi:MAG: zinc ribbon domain-containing protein [Oscillospiraceae bacterium]|nr:zinc ribbon domain-containing protein [Oscillospiraceae bacterium]